jgi:hypothetical protein
MRLPLVVEAGDSVRDGAFESVGIGDALLHRSPAWGGVG